MSSQGIKERIAQLEAELREVEAAEKAERKAKLDAIPKVFEYQVVWESDFRLRIECKLTDECAAAREAAGEIYTDTMRRGNGWHGMRHIMIGNYVWTDGGGSVVTTLDRGFNADPHLLSDADAAALRAGHVPESIRKPW